MSYVSELEEELEKIKAGINDLLEAPSRVASIVDHTKERISYMYADQLFMVPNREELDIVRGMFVRVHAEGGIVQEHVDVPQNVGTMARVNKLIDEGTAQVLVNDEQKRTVYFRQDVLKLEEGDSVLVYGNGVVRKIESAVEGGSVHTEATNVRWENIGGLEDAKRAMQEAIELPHKHPEIFSRYGKKPTKGILLYGPPGCGKTMLGKAAATSLADIHGDSASTGFIYVKGPELLSKWVGEAESRIRGLFTAAREHKKKNGYPAVLFIDEADALLGKRTGRSTSGIERTTVPQFLAEMDGLNDSGCMVLLATNLPDSLDPAVVRDGRVDQKVRVSRPTQDSAGAIFDIHLVNKPLQDGFCSERFKQTAIERIFDPAAALRFIDTQDGEVAFTLGDVVSGAMIEAVVENATSSALHRDIETGNFSGIGIDDVVSSVLHVHKQNLEVSQDSNLAYFFEQRGIKPRSVRKAVFA